MNTGILSASPGPASAARGGTWGLGRAVAATVAVLVTSIAVALAIVYGTKALVTWTAVAAFIPVAWLSLKSRSALGSVLVLGVVGFGVVAALWYHVDDAAFYGWRAEATRATANVPRDELVLPFLVAASGLWLAFMLFGTPVRASRNSSSLPSLQIPVIALAFAGAILALNVFGVGPSTIWHAGEYLEHTGPLVAVKLGGALGPVAVLICGYFAFDRNRSVAIRVSALVLALAFEAVYFGAASRHFALWFVLMFAGGMLTGSWKPTERKVALILTVVFALVAIQVPLGLRNLPKHGLAASTDYLAHEPATVFGNTDPINNILFGAPLAHYVGHSAPKIKASMTAVSLSPFPSSFNNWNEISPLLRANTFTPYNAIGELLNRGWAFLALGSLFLGILFVLAERLVLSIEGPVGQTAYLVILGLAGSFVFISTQYNLRSAVRIPYYAIALAIVAYGFNFLFSSTIQKKRNHGSPR